MLHSTARKTEQGFTLVENIIVAVIVSILAAISIPSLVGMRDRASVNSAASEVKGALQQAQREAIRRSRPCTVTLSATSITATNTAGEGCIAGRDLPDGVTLSTNIGTSGSRTIEFNIRGGVDNPNSTGKIVLSSSNTASKKCIVLSQGIGLMRSGTYSGDIASDANITSGTCTIQR